MRVDKAWVIFDTRRNAWLIDTGDWAISWTNQFSQAQLYRTKEEARWAAYVGSVQCTPGSLQLQQVEAVWTIKSKELYAEK